jgi:hypothetical protein
MTVSFEFKNDWHIWGQYANNKMNYLKNNFVFPNIIRKVGKKVKQWGCKADKIGLIGVWELT